MTARPSMRCACAAGECVGAACLRPECIDLEDGHGRFGPCPENPDPESPGVVMHNPVVGPIYGLLLYYTADDTAVIRLDPSHTVHEVATRDVEIVRNP